MREVRRETFTEGRFTLVFMGYGEFEKTIKEYAGKNKNIHFYPAVPLEKVLDYTQHADVGLSLIERVCLSYYLCLPNKVFEYILEIFWYKEMTKSCLSPKIFHIKRYIREFDFVLIFCPLFYQEKSGSPKANK